MDNKKMPRKQEKRFGPPNVGMVDKPKNLKKTAFKLLKYMGRYKYLFLTVLILAVISTFFSIIGPDILARAVDLISDGFAAKLKGTGGIDYTGITSIMILLLGLYGISAVCSVVMGFLNSFITQKITFRMRREVSEKIHRLPMSYFDKKQTGDILSIVTNDIDTLSMGMNQSTTQLISNIVMVGGVLVMMFRINWIMTLVALIILPISTFLISFIVKKSQKFFKSQQVVLGNVNGIVEETFSGLTIVQAFNCEDKTNEKFNKANNALCEAGWKSNFLSGLMMPMMTFVGNLGYVAIAILGSILMINSSITIGDLTAFITYMRNFTMPIGQLAQVSNMLQSTIAAAERVFEILEENEEEQTALIHAPVAAEELNGSVQFNNVRFGYSDDKIVINNFTANVEEGKKIAIVGHTGAGKTTMVKLLMRFYDLNGGKISIDGHDITSFDRNELRHVFGMVLQDTWLFSGTIMENIRYGKLDAKDDEVYEAANAAYAHRFIQNLPDGYSMLLNEEATNVSGGQKQLLTIARTILSDPKILILDEATSSVDTRTEQQIQKAMDFLMKGRTSFIIAHRLSTIKNADLILMMDKGDIAEQGTHEELLSANGAYAEMYNAQFK